LAVCLACAVTGAGLALTDCGAQLYDIPVGTVVDMSKFGHCSGHLCAAVLPQLQQIAMIYAHDTRIKNEDALKDALQQAIQTAGQMAQTIKHCVKADLEEGV
uniref:PNP_UDP_1 domain-containing protein n=1 Tax=Echinostoma caproni TaxID=27848 RepID=A0A183BBF4_9TREM